MARNGSNEASNDPRSACVLLFSGGRDSSIAAVRLGRDYSRVELVTVSTDHLFGINYVIGRLGELKRHLNGATRWYHFSFHGEMETGSELLRTCLPCHAVYLLAGLQVAAENDIADIAFGYTQYQSSWAEQTAQSRNAISDVIALFGRRAIFPVADLESKEQAIVELRAFGLSELALEQKCLRQQLNEASDQQSLETEIQRWGGSLTTALEVELAKKLRLVRSLALSDIEEIHSCLPVI
jgi:hypothetical protein